MGHHTPSSLSLDCPMTSPEMAQRVTLVNEMEGVGMAPLLSRHHMGITEDQERNRVAL